MTISAPPLQISERDGRVRLSLGDFSYAEGETLQDAADELVRRMLVIAMAFRDGGVGAMCSESPLDLPLLDFIWRLGDVAASGGDIRALIFGPNPLAA
jgi:hypothetical protein